MKRKKPSRKQRSAPREKVSSTLETPKRRLRVIQEPGGVRRLGWQTPVFTPVWQNDLALAAANTALEILGGTLNRQGLVELGRKLLAAQSALSAGLIAQGNAGPTSCGDGCDFCCHQIIGATPLELLVILDYLRAQAVNIPLLQERASALADAARDLGPAARYARGQPCVFLVDHRCSIYEVRPLTCRGMNALDRTVCETLLDSQTEREARWQRGQGSAGYVEPVHAAHSLSAGLQIALYELYTLDMHPVDLTLAVDHLLNRVPSALEDWLAGKTSFVSVRGAHDSANSERLRSVGVSL
jgi:Fe-S-cluster containining protein